MFNWNSRHLIAASIFLILFRVDGFQQNYNRLCRASQVIHAMSSSMNNGFSSENPLRIGTRASPLALAQANEVKRLLQKKFPELQSEGAIEIKKIMTKGDSILNKPLTEIGGKGLFTKEIDQALINFEVDICVHSMKDVPTQIAPGTLLPCILEREDTNDVFISQKYSSIYKLPAGAVIGTSSLRRQAQLLNINPAIKVVNFRGNVQTRLKKIENGVVDGTLLALAGLKRLSMDELIKRSFVINRSFFVPAIAQGAIGIQCREPSSSNDATIVQFLSALDHKWSHMTVACERAFLKELDGNCRMPIAGRAFFDRNLFHFTGLIAKPNGEDLLRFPIIPKGRLNLCKVEEAVDFGKKVAQDLKAYLGEEKYKSYHQAFSEHISP